MPLATSTFNPAGDFVAREPMQYQADPLSDATMAAVIGPWASTVAVASAAYLIAMHASQWLAIKEVNALRATWTSNATIHAWHVPEAIAQDHIKLALAVYLRAGKTLPDWADPAKITRAEALFMEYGALSCLLLFCASFPDCCVVPDLAALLHVAGQLEQHTEYRIRSTAAMIFPVMMRGGLTGPAGAGVSQALKVRLIHATIRNLILCANPAQ